jgi:Zn-dependent M28 family amino/carboxypeptidase
LRPIKGTVTDLTENLTTHIQTLAHDIGERNHKRYRELDDAARYIENAFRAAGCEPRSQEYTARGKRYRNIEVEFAAESPDSGILIIGAHYDTAHGSPGANDNASGIAGLIEIARGLQSVKVRRTLRLVAFVNEERPFLRTPLMGSRVYAEACRRRGDRVEGMISLETIGSKSETQRFSFGGLLLPTRGDFIGVVGNRRSRQLVLACDRMLRRSQSIPVFSRWLPGALPGVKSSDHWSFWKEGFPAVMITDTAPLRYSHYHRATDTPDKICPVFLRNVIQAVQDLATQATEGAPLGTVQEQESAASGKGWKMPVYGSVAVFSLVACLALMRVRK